MVPIGVDTVTVPPDTFRSSGAVQSSPLNGLSVQKSTANDCAAVIVVNVTLYSTAVALIAELVASMLRLVTVAAEAAIGIRPGVKTPSKRPADASNDPNRRSTNLV